MKPRHAAALALGLLTWLVTELGCALAAVVLSVWIGELLEVKPPLIVAISAGAVFLTLRFCVRQLLKEHHWVFTDERVC